MSESERRLRMNEKYIMAFDLGTTNTRCMIFDKRGNIVSIATNEFAQIYPREGYVEHDPLQIWEAQLAAARDALRRAGLKAKEIAAIGITNQRETTVIWDKKTGEPVYNAIVWQCRRTAKLCRSLKDEGLEAELHEKTGLLLYPYFSATKIMWILENVEGARERAERGELLFGTIDTWIIWKLTNGEKHVTDYTNASRTMLFNINELKWDEDILKKLHIPPGMLPEVKPSSHVYGFTSHELFGECIPIAGAAGDQQAALFGQKCRERGDVKNTYGTGCFLLMNTGKTPIFSDKGLLTTLACDASGQPCYAIEGSVFIAGAAIQWLRDEVGLLEKSSESEEMARKVLDTGGVYMVPAFTGLGAPHWEPYARGIITGLTRGTNKNHIVRAALESLAYQSCDLIRLMEEEAGIRIKSLKVDGGAAGNDFLMQFQADLLGVHVLRPENIEITCLGAAYLAGLATGYWSGAEDIGNNDEGMMHYNPVMNAEKRAALLKGWHRAVEAALLLARE